MAIGVVSGILSSFQQIVWRRPATIGMIAGAANKNDRNSSNIPTRLSQSTLLPNVNNPDVRRELARVAGCHEGDE